MENHHLIEDLNRQIRNCNKCILAETRSNALCGEGNLHPRFMLIAQTPGKDEDREGKMFIGPSGRMLDELLSKAGIEREEVYITNLIKCRLPRCQRLTSEEVKICNCYLDREIELINPRVMVPLGYFSTHFVLNKYNFPVPEMTASNKKLYGKLFLSKTQKIFPLPHPGSLLYNQSSKLWAFEKYRKLKVLSKPCKLYPLCPTKGLGRRGELDREWIELFCRGDWESCFMYQMELHGEQYPDSSRSDATLLHDREKDLEPEAMNEGI